MKQRANRLLRLLYPREPALVFLILFSTIGLVLVFTREQDDTPAAYAVYGISAYTLTAAVLRCVRLAKRGKAALHRHPLAHRYLTDLDFKAEISLYLSLGVNTAYAVYKGAAGIFLHSAWFGAMAFYYLVLSAERFLLLHSLRKSGENLRQAYGKTRFCGYLLLVLTAAIAAMGFYTVAENRAVSYPGYILYAAAAYTFYSFGMGIANLVRYRKRRNPLYGAGKAITFTTALVSLFFLQTAMFAEFGDNSPWQKGMNIGAGAGVFLLAAAIAVWTILRGARGLTRLAREEEEPV